jgi:hypothetical protein
MELVEPGQDDAGKVGIMPRPPSKRVVLNGANSVQRATQRKGPLGEYPALAEYPFGLTTVDEDFWKKWLERHKDFDFIKNGSIFVAKDDKAAKAMAEERVHDVKTGLEPLKPSVDGKPSGDKRLGTTADPSMAQAMRQNEQELPPAA